MGAFLVNVQVRTAWSDGLPSAVKAVCRGASRVAPTGDGWAGVYNERLDAQDEKELLRVGRALSKRLAAPAVAFLVHDSDVLAAWTFAGGRVANSFNSAPDYFGDDSAPPPDYDATAAALASVAGVEAAAVREVLTGEWTFADEQLRALAAMLGIDADAACGFADAASLPNVVEVGGRRKRRPRPGEFSMVARAVALIHLPCELRESNTPQQSPADLERFARHEAEMESWEHHVPPDVDALLAAAVKGPRAFARLVVAEGKTTATECASILAGVGCGEVLREMHVMGHDLTAPPELTSPPIFNAWPRTLTTLLDLGLDVNTLFNGMTPLATALMSGAGDAARLLLDRGADATLTPSGRSMRSYADFAQSLGKPLPDDVLARLP